MARKLRYTRFGPGARNDKQLLRSAERLLRATAPPSAVQAEQLTALASEAGLPLPKRLSGRQARELIGLLEAGKVGEARECIKIY